MINRFDKQYSFLSNFYPCRVEYEGLEYCSVEAAFQAAKTLDIHTRKQFCYLTPSAAKKQGRKLDLRPDWEQVKKSIMLELVTKKFQDETLKKLLLSTCDEELVEGNTWHDTYWGVCNGVGQNNLGKILMQIRKNLQKQLTE